MSATSVGCVLWLERFQPVFASMAVLSLGYQGWLVWRRPRRARTRAMLLTLWVSLFVSAGVAAGLLALSARYR